MMRKNFLVLFIMFFTSCSGKHSKEMKDENTLLAEGAARVQFYKIYVDIYEKDKAINLKFSDFEMIKEKLIMSDAHFTQYTWTYKGQEDLGLWAQYSVFIAPSEEGIWIEQGKL